MQRLNNLTTLSSQEEAESNCVYRNVIDHKQANKTIILQASCLSERRTPHIHGLCIDPVLLACATCLARHLLKHSLCAGRHDRSHASAHPRHKVSALREPRGAFAHRSTFPLPSSSNPTPLARASSTPFLASGCVLLYHDIGGNEPLLPVHSPRVQFPLERRGSLKRMRCCGRSAACAPPAAASCRCCATREVSESASRGAASRSPPFLCTGTSGGGGAGPICAVGLAGRGCGDRRGITTAGREATQPGVLWV